MKLSVRFSNTSQNVLLLGLLAWPFCCQGFTEAPELAARVVQKTLPPVYMRLPVHPEVIVTRESGGRYGGTLRTALLATGDGNGVLRFIAQGLTRWDTKFDRVLPNIAESWTVTPDATEYVFTLRRGMRWSDGVPFTADDIVFAVNDVIGNREISGLPASRYQAAGKTMQARRIDDTHVLISFAAGNRMLPEELAGPYGHHPVIYPKHYCSQFLASYNPKVDDLVWQTGLENRQALFENRCSAYANRWSNPDKPTLDPWILAGSMQDTGSLIARRNPYFWQVDPEGRQLPYLDAIRFDLLPDAESVTAEAALGLLDMQIRHITGVASRDRIAPLLMRGSHVLMTMPDVNASAVGLYLNHTTKRLPLRTLFADLRFKAALSLAIDRDDIAKTVFRGDACAWQVGPPKGHRFYNEKLATQYTRFDLAEANRLLDSVGLLKRDPHGLRLTPEGERVSMHAIVNNYSGQMVATLQRIRDTWAKAGVELVIEAQDRVIVGRRAFSNDYDIGVDVVSGGVDPTQNPRAYLAQHPADSRQGLPWVQWYNSQGELGMEPPPAMKQRLQLWDQWKAARTQDEADELFRQILAIAADQLEVLGTVTSPPQTGIRNVHLHGVTDNMPGAWIWPTPNPSLPQQYFFAR